jgi:hypothetical protein
MAGMCLFFGSVEYKTLESSNTACSHFLKVSYLSRGGEPQTFFWQPGMCNGARGARENPRPVA